MSGGRLQNLALRCATVVGRALGKLYVAASRRVDRVQGCNTCPFLYVSLPHGQNCNRCMHPMWSEGLKLKRPMFSVATLRESFPPASSWDHVAEGRRAWEAENGEPFLSIEEGYTPGWCPLKRDRAVLVIWRGRAE